MASSSCQFWGIASVLQAYDMRGLDMWAICHGKQFISKGDDRSDLSSFLELLSNGFSNATYTLKVYEGLSLSDIKDNTPCDGSFNFCIAQNNAVAGFGGGGGNEVLLGRIAALEKKLAEPKDDTPTIGSVIMGWLQDPEPLIQIIQGFKMLTGQPVVERAAGVAPKHRIPAADFKSEIQSEVKSEIQVDDDETRRARLVAALDILGKNDPEFLDHLEQLAEMSENNPAFFKGLLKMLPKK